MGTVDPDALMARFADNDVAAFEELYHAYEGRVYGFCLRLLGDPDAAADAFQETFKRVVDGRARYDARGRFDSWIFTIARRICIDHVRAERRLERLDLASVPLVDERESAAQQLSVEEEVLRRLAALPHEQREVLILNRYHGFTYREIAEMIGSTEPAVKQKAYRAVESLRRSENANREVSG